MQEFQIQVDIQAAPDRVWSVLRDVERWHEWTASVTSINLREHGPLVVGSTAIVRQPKLPPARWKVTAVDDAHRTFTWESWAPGVRVIANHSVAQVGTGSRATLSVAYAGMAGPLLVRLLGDLNDRYLAMEAEGLRKRSEQPPR